MPTSNRDDREPITRTDVAAKKTFCFLIDNIPYPTSWQELKDLFRIVVTFPGYVAQPMFPHGKANGYSWMRAGSPQDARRIFEYSENLTVEGHRLRVHVFEFEIDPTYAELVGCNCPRDEHGVTHAAYPEALGYSVVNSHIVVAYMSEEVSVNCLPRGASGINMGASTIGIRVSTANLSNGRRGSVSTAAGTGDGGDYSIVAATPDTSAENAEVITSHFPTGEEMRTVQILNVNETASIRDLESHLRKYGNLQRCTRLRGTATGSPKTVQVLAIYDTVREADQAAREIPRRRWAGHKLNARRARTVEEPLIANGSGQRAPLDR